MNMHVVWKIWYHYGYKKTITYEYAYSSNIILIQILFFAKRGCNEIYMHISHMNQCFNSCKWFRRWKIWEIVWTIKEMAWKTKGDPWWRDNECVLAANNECSAVMQMRSAFHLQTPASRQALWEAWVVSQRATTIRPPFPWAPISRLMWSGTNLTVPGE